MDYEAFTIKEFLGIILIGFPVLIYVAFVLLEFIARIREIFEKQKDIFHHHYHYRDRR